MVANRLHAISWNASLIVALAGLLVHFLQPDSLAFVTVFPVWCWWLPGVILAAISWRNASLRLRLLVTVAWAIAIVISSDTPIALLRRAPPSARPTAVESQQQTLRVVSFNTGSERYRSPDEIALWQPDIVLLQESYPRDDVEKLAVSLFGDAAGWVWNNDTAILARGRVMAIAPDDSINRPFVLAAVHLRGGPELKVVSLRLAPQPVRFDFWSPDCWRNYADIRRQHRQQLQDALNSLSKFTKDTPLILGGDFNAPARDAIFQPLLAKYTEAFAHAGRGWGCTLPNRLPLLRIDQIWSANRLEPMSAWSVSSLASDHRLVIAEFQLRLR